MKFSVEAFFFGETILATSGKASWEDSQTGHFCVFLGGISGGLVSCGNPFRILHRGDVFSRFQKHKLLLNDFSVLKSSYFVFLLPDTLSSSLHYLNLIC